MASSSPVLIPGRTASLSTESVRATTCPAAYMRAICSADLTWISGSLRSRMPHLQLQRYLATGRTSVHVRLQGGQRPLGDLFHRPGRVNADENVLVRVEGDQGRRLGAVNLQPVPDDLFLVVVALEELAAAVVADAHHGGRLIEHMPDPLAAPAGATAGQAPDDLVLVDDELEHDREPRIELVEHLLQRVGLGHVPREAVK